MDYFAENNNPKGIPYAIRYFSIIAETLAPLIVIAIAIPFAVSGVRVNPAVGASKAIGLFALYYVFDTVAGVLANQGILEPVMAAWLPDVGMMALAVYFFARLR